MEPTTQVGGCDLGKATARFVTARIGDGGALSIESVSSVAHEGRPFEAFADWYRRDGRRCAAITATGLYSRELIEPIATGIPEDACIEAALRLHRKIEGAINVVSAGARGYSALSRDASGKWRFAETDKCSSGTGETMVKLAARFGLDLGEADRLAGAAGASIPITARCSVFAKSELTHFANQGRPRDQLLRGWFEAVARHVAALLDRVRVPGPVLAVGGLSRLPTFVGLLGAALKSPVEVPDDAPVIEAIGAAAIAAERLRGRSQSSQLPDDPRELRRASARRIRALPAARTAQARVRRLEARSVPEAAAQAPAILGLDLGSTGSKAALVSLATGELVLDIWDRTRGNPVDAMQRLVAAVLARAPAADVRAIGVTGSGREAAASVARAALSGAHDRILVLNEIVAHATAAIAADPDHGKSLSVVEIGGQDAKFIQIAGGRIVESDMNKACSAGTGSFLEEQAILYGVQDVADFGAVAATAERPADLGQTCTVFVADAAAEAEEQGFGRADIFAGFEYSVVHNYLHRVMGQRTFGDKIFFQGKPASSPSLAWTLASVTGREVLVPANPGVMGALGIALEARAAFAKLGIDRAPRLDMSALLAAAVVDRGEIRCRDDRCGTMCIVDKSTVRIGAAVETVYSGGACPKFEVAAAGAAAASKLPIDAPSPFDERQKLIERWIRRDRGAGGPSIAVPLVGAIQAILPWVVTLLEELGARVTVLEPDAGALSRGEARCPAYDACAPVKIAHGVAAAAQASVLFFPKVLDLPYPAGGDAKTCPMEQALPDILAAAAKERGETVEVLRPELSFAGRLEMLRGLAPIAARLGAASGARLPLAVSRAGAAQRRYEEELAAIGRRALKWAGQNRAGVVLVLGPLHVLHDPGISARIPSILRQSGVVALPMDCYPLPDGTPTFERVAWADARRALRSAVAARARGGIYPILLSSFGCGPASFNEHLFSALMEGYPHTALESDGHGGTAGYVTRIQSFLHTVRADSGAPAPLPRDRLAWLERKIEPSFSEEKGSRLVVMSLSDRFSPIAAAFYRSMGFDAVPAGPSSAEVLATGRRDCSGKECLPYQLIWGAFRQQVDRAKPDQRTVLLQISGDGMCRTCMFSLKDELALDRAGKTERVIVRHLRPEPEIELEFVGRFWAAVVAWDIMHQLLSHHRPLERWRGAADEAYRVWTRRLEGHTEQRAGDGLRAAVGYALWWRDLGAIVEDASKAFESLRDGGKRRDAPTVLLAGDIYLRLDDFGSDHLVRRLNERGISVVLEPTNSLVEYFAAERLSEMIGLPTGLVKNAVLGRALGSIRRKLYERARKIHPWLPMPDPAAALEASRPLIGRHPAGEAPVTIGGVIDGLRRHGHDGVVVLGPWGCGPSLIAESFLRPRDEVPSLFLYADGSPIDDRRLDAFAFRLERARRQRYSA